MIIKNAKTVLFAGLIAAMILPFSVMDYADAQTTHYDRSANVSDVIDELIVEYNNLEDQRQALITELRTTETTDTSDIDSEISEIKAEMDEVLEKVERLSLREGEYNPSEKSETSISAITDGYYISVDDIHTECDDWNITQSIGAGGSINTASNGIYWGYVWPSDKSAGWSVWTGCTDVSFDKLKIMTRNITQAQRCNDVISTQSSDFVSQECVCGLADGELLAWQIESTYSPSSGTNTQGNDTFYGMHRIG